MAQPKALGNKDYITVYQFKVSLLGISPPIWRRVQIVSNSTFADMHELIQSSMGWHDLHMHQFNVKRNRGRTKCLIGEPKKSMAPGPVLDEAKCRIGQFLSMHNRNGRYLYDFGDTWDHKLFLEKTWYERAGNHGAFPRCIKGARACPPEDSGGPHGYQQLLDVIDNPEHELHQEKTAWLQTIYGEERFDPEKFDPEDGC